MHERNLCQSVKPFNHRLILIMHQEITLARMPIFQTLQRERERGGGQWINKQQVYFFLSFFLFPLLSPTLLCIQFKEQKPNIVVLFVRKGILIARLTRADPSFYYQAGQQQKMMEKWNSSTYFLSSLSLCVCVCVCVGVCVYVWVCKCVSMSMGKAVWMCARVMALMCEDIRVWGCKQRRTCVGVLVCVKRERDRWIKRVWEGISPARGEYFLYVYVRVWVQERECEREKEREYERHFPISPHSSRSHFEATVKE